MIAERLFVDLNESMKSWLLEIQSGWYMTVLALFSLLIWWSAVWSGPSQPSVIPNFIVQSHTCVTASQDESSLFYIYSSGATTAKILNDEVCNDSVVNKQFSRVKSFWGVSDVKTIELIGKGVANLALVKENIMSALRAEETHGYTKIATYPNYQAYFIALREKPRLDKAYLLDKSIGLINYPTSRSGHIIPKQLLSDLGLSLKRLNIVYASSHSQLRQLLAEGKVDIISSYWQKEDELRFSSNYRTAVASPVSGSSWYLKLSEQNNDLLCASQLILKRFSESQDLSYYQNLNLVPFPACSSVLESPVNRLREIGHD